MATVATGSVLDESGQGLQGIVVVIADASSLRKHDELARVATVDKGAFSLHYAADFANGDEPGKTVRQLRLRVMLGRHELKAVGRISVKPVAVAPKRAALPASQLQARTGAAARSPLRAVGRRRYLDAATAPVARTQALLWAIVPLTEGAAAAVGPALQTWSEYRAQLGQLNRGGVIWQMVPRHELAA